MTVQNGFELRLAFLASSTNRDDEHREVSIALVKHQAAEPHFEREVHAGCMRAQGRAKDAVHKQLSPREQAGSVSARGLRCVEFDPVARDFRRQ